MDEGPQLANEALAVPQGLQRIISDVMCHTAGPKLQFAGLREVFLVWQRYNRHHGKPFYCVEGATGAKPEVCVRSCPGAAAFAPSGLGTLGGNAT